MSATSEDKNNDQSSADLAETPELVVTTQDIMVAEQNHELATATDFETPDTTTTRQQDQHTYSPFRDGENRPGTTADPPNNAGNQERSSYHMGTTLTATTDRIDQALRQGPIIDENNARNQTVTGQNDQLPMQPTNQTNSMPQADMQTMMTMMATAISQMAPANGQNAEMAALQRQIESLTRLVDAGRSEPEMNTTIHNPLDALTENQIYKTVQQRMGKSKFGGALPSNKVKGPILFQWEMDMLAILKVLNLYPAILGEDLTDRAQNLSAYAITQGLTEDMQTRIAAQPRLTTSGLELWNYLQQTYAPKGINGMIFGLTTLRDATVDEPVTPDAVRSYIDNLRVLWLFNERQICPIVTWGCKLEMIFRALEAPWAVQFKYQLTCKLQTDIAARTDEYRMTADDGESLVTSVIADLLEFMATVDVSTAMASPGRAEIHSTYTQPRGKGKGKGGKGGGKSKGKGAAGRQMLAEERARIQEYYRHKTADERATRMASRINDTCGRCGQTGHWRMDPECPGPDAGADVHVTEIDM